MQESTAAKELPACFWKSAQSTCDAILSSNPPYRSPPEDQRNCRAIITEIQAMIQSDWIDAHRLELQYIPSGWKTLVRDVLRAALYMLKQADRRQLSVLVGKEKFGELRISFANTGILNLDNNLQYIQSWALEQSRTRCGGTGKIGEMTTSGRIIPLSPELLELSLSDRNALRKIITMF